MTFVGPSALSTSWFVKEGPGVVRPLLPLEGSTFLQMNDTNNEHRCKE
jgi:hypothetical protein